MKKYLSGIIAVVIALAFVAFNVPSNTYDGSKLFRYTAPGGSYTDVDVQNNSNWVYIADGIQDCPLNVKQKACEMLVDETQVNIDNTLKSTFSIPVEEYSNSDKYFVTAPEGAIPFNRSL